MKRALITGIFGQDGSYLSEYLLELGYEVWGLARNINDELTPPSQVRLLQGDLTDRESVRKALVVSSPNEIYNLAAQSDVGRSFTSPEETLAVNYTGFLDLVEEAVAYNPSVRIYQAASSEMFGNAPAPQNELSDLLPVSPYAISKTRAHAEIVLPYRAKGIFICSGILFNHESPQRPVRFVTRKITSSLTQIKLGLLASFSLGNIDARRDWGFAGDYVKAMQSMLQQSVAEDFVIATGISHSVRDFIEAACRKLSMPITWEGSGVDEIAKDHEGRAIITINPEFYRPQEPHLLIGDSSHARSTLRWAPTTSFDELVSLMVDADLAKFSGHSAPL